MTCPRQQREELEKTLIGKYGCLSVNSRGREREDEPCSIRTSFQRDIDRITHSKPFRRLKRKTQVFLQPDGDHYRTRLTHTLEVSRLARTVARALELNEDLTEAIALGHDLGHTPFGHAGERALNDIFPSGFRHYEQSLRVVDHLAHEAKGLNLCYETRMGILHHTHGAQSNEPKDTLEAVCVRFCDRIAYMNHDLDDAIRANVLTNSDVPENIRESLGNRNSQRINSLILDLIENSQEGELAFSPEMRRIHNEFHDFMYEAVYYNPVVKGEERKVFGIIDRIFEHYVKNPEKLSPAYQRIADEEGIERAVCDYVSGMTDEFALYKYNEFFIPAAWSGR